MIGRNGFLEAGERKNRRGQQVQITFEAIDSRQTKQGLLLRVCLGGERDDEVRQLATLYTRASFREGGLRADELAAARDAWSRIRSSYPGLVAKAWRDALRRGRVLRAEGAASESHEPSPRR